METEEQILLKIEKIIKDSRLITNSRLISESALNGILNVYFNDGFIILTSYRAHIEDNTIDNNRDFYELKRTIRNSGYGFIPVYGGMIVDSGEATEREVKVPVIIIVNQKADAFKAFSEDKKLFELGVSLINKYNQDLFLYKPIGETNESFYVNKSGEIDMKFTNKTKSDLVSVFFTDLIKKCSVKDDPQRLNDLIFTKNKYINRSPLSFSEALSRYGERFFSTN